MVDSTVTLEWALTREQDRYSNRIDYIWSTADVTDGGVSAIEHRLSRIRYTSRGASTGNREVVLHYELRPDPRRSWTSGVQRRERYRVRSLEMRAPDVPGGAALLQWSYQLAYDSSSVTGSSRLVSARRCSGVTCQSPTRFDWTSGAMATERQDVSGSWNWRSSGGPRLTQFIPADVDGDGRTDLIGGSESSPSRWNVTFASDLGFTRAAPETVLEYEVSIDYIELPFSERPLLVDLDGDGRAEILGLNHAWGPSYPALAAWALLSVDRAGAPGSGTSVEQWLGGYVLEPDSSNSAYVADFDGNGTGDLLLRDSGDRWEYRSGSGNVGPAAFGAASSHTIGLGPVTPNWGEGSIFLADLTGDSRREILVPLESSSEPTFDAVNFGSGAASVTVPNVRPDSEDLRFMDVNGDGLRDVVDLAIFDGTLRVRINTGNGFEPWRTASSTDGSEYLALGGIPHSHHLVGHRFHITDYDLDGRDDIVVPQTQRVYLMNGDT